MGAGWNKRLPTLALVLATIIWGGGFLATQMVIDSGYSSGLIILLRFSMASALMLAIGAKRIFPLSRKELRDGFLAGLLLFLGFYFQTIGLRFTTPSNNGFFTATNVIIVPFIAWVVHKKRPPLKLFFCSCLALCGFFILAWNPGSGFSINLGDVLTLLSAFFFASHIVCVAVVSPGFDSVRLTFLQLLSCAILALVAFLAFDLHTLADIRFLEGLPPILYLALMSTLLCFLLQTWALGRMNPGQAAVVIATESLWCMVFSVLLGYEALSIPMVVGGVTIVLAVCLLEVELPRRKKQKELADETVVARI